MGGWWKFCGLIEILFTCVRPLGFLVQPQIMLVRASPREISNATAPRSFENFCEHLFLDEVLQLQLASYGYDKK